MPAVTTERRQHARSRTLIGAQIIFNQRRSTLDCTVRNLSEHGALLVLSDAVSTPELFELYLPLKRESRMVRARWRDHREPQCAARGIGAARAGKVL